MGVRFSKRSHYVKASDVRELLKITEQPGVISFAGGLPAPELFPVEQLQAVSQAVFNKRGQSALQYSTTEGYAPLREQIAARIKKNGIDASADEIMITAGSQQGLDLTGKVFLDEGDVVICERPTYLAAINAFQAYLPAFADVEMDENGMVMEALEECLKNNPKAKFIYTIPDFQNPTGKVMSLERRKRLIELANRYDIIVIEDNPYGELRFEGEPLPSVKHFDTQDRVIYLGTFSKILAPGLRIGWVHAPKELLHKYLLFKQGADLHTSTLAQMQASMFLDTCCIETHIQTLTRQYARRADVMMECIKAELNGVATCEKPQGGLFLWLRFQGGCDARELLKKCIGKDVAFVPGESFYANDPDRHTARLNYSNATEERIREGIRRIAEAFRQP